MSNFYKNENSYRGQRNNLTFFRSNKDLRKILELTHEALIEPHEGYKSPLDIDEYGYRTIESLLTHLKKLSGLDYLNITHIVELFFKDHSKKILISNSDRIKLKTVNFVEPPEVLYFGTLYNLRDRMETSGIRSKTKGYIKLYNSEDLAKEFASKFALDPDDYIVTIAIDAKRASKEGLKFSTYIPNQFIVSHVDTRYILKGL